MGLTSSDRQLDLFAICWLQLLYSFLVFFFFQAADGIRDIGVTGVQTCALPISARGCTPTAIVRTGTVLRTIAVGVRPLAVAVDERTGRAFVVNYGGAVRASAPWWEHDVQRLRL